jgi:hypothetical protein
MPTDRFARDPVVVSRQDVGLIAQALADPPYLT